MKKIFIFFIISIFLIYPTFGKTSAENVNEVIIENGLTVFTLEDYSNPLVRIEINVRAGVSLQNAQNAGFFQLLSNLIQKSSKNKFDSVECGADSTRFILNISPSVLEEILFDLSDDIFNPIFSDGLLKQEFASMKREVLQNVNDPTYLINSSIDARVFADTPWKHDTGIYPSLFSKLTEYNARVLLNEILTNFYTPQNTAIFISGNIHSSEILSLIKNSFGRFYSNKKTNFMPLKTTSENAKKFVIHDNLFSDELTQVVVQYVLFEDDEATIAANVLNNNFSEFKRSVSSIKELNIPGEEYIDISAAYKSGCTRLIFQTLMQNTKSETPVNQAIKFSETTKQNTTILYDEFLSSLSQNNHAYKKQISSSSNFMYMLSSFWTTLPYKNLDNSSMTENYRSLVSYQLETHNENLKHVNLSSVQNVFQNENPFVFVIMNTKEFNKYKKEFLENNFEEVTVKNGSWYTQTLYKNINSYKDFLTADIQTKKDEINYTTKFYETSKDSITSTNLSNGIKLCIKENPNTTGMSFIISIDGGNLRSADDHGFEEVMTNILATNILRQIEIKRRQNLIVNDYDIYSETNLNFSRIVIECDVDDFVPILNSCANALILDEIIPSDADMIVQGRRTRKRLENGSTVNQLYSAAINKVLPNSPYTKIFETENEVLSNTTYEKILQNYSELLDAARFSLVVSGNVKADEVTGQVEKVFSVLQNQSVSKKLKKENSVSQLKFPSGKQQKVKLNHTFLTDVSAKDAGPMPAVLIPTKKFADPVLFCIKAPDFESDDFFVFNMILPHLQKEMSDYADERKNLFNCKISVSQASAYIPMASFTFSAVEKTSAADTTYKTVLENLKTDLMQTQTSKKLLQKIKDIYIASEFQDALTNSGSAILIDNGLHENSATTYLENYYRANNVTTEQIINVLEKYFYFDDLYRLYSNDSRK